MIKAMYDLLLPKAAKVDQIDPLKDRVEVCESQVDVLNVVVKGHVTDKAIHRAPRQRPIQQQEG